MAERIRIVDGPWPERIGCEGVIVDPTSEQARIYPFRGLGLGEAVVLLDRDPLLGRGTVAIERGWSCVIRCVHLEVIPKTQPATSAHAAGCCCVPCVRVRASILPWRIGGQVGRTIYIDPGDGRKDPAWLIGMMDTAWWAEHVVHLHNSSIGDDDPPPDPDPVRIRARAVAEAALSADLNPPGQEWNCGPDWTGYGFDRVAEIAVRAIAAAGLLRTEP